MSPIYKTVSLDQYICWKEDMILVNINAFHSSLQYQNTAWPPGQQLRDILPKN